MRISAYCLLIATFVLFGGCVDTSGLRTGGGDDPPTPDGSTDDAGMEDVSMGDGSTDDADPPVDTGPDAPPPTDGNPPMDTDPPDDGSPMDTMPDVPPGPSGCARPMVLMGQVSGTASERLLRRFSVAGGTWTECDAIDLGGDLPSPDLVGYLTDHYIVVSSGFGSAGGAHFIRENNTLANRVELQARSNGLYDSAVVNVNGTPTFAIGSIYNVGSRRSSFNDISCIEFLTRNERIKSVNTANSGNLCTGELESIEGWGGTAGFGTNAEDPNSIVATRSYHPLMRLNPTSGARDDLLPEDRTSAGDNGVTVTSARVGDQTVYGFLNSAGGYELRTRLGLEGDRFTHSCTDCTIEDFILDPEEAGSVYVTCGPQEVRRIRIDGTCTSIATSPAGTRISDLFVVR